MNLVGTQNESVRIKWLEEVLRKMPSGLRILDAGAGEMQLKRFCSHLKYVSQDFGKYDGRGDNRGLQTGSWNQSSLDIVSDITTIPEENESFDIILCVEVLEHLPEPILAIKEFSRLLKKGGELILTTPFCSLTHFAPYHFYSGFNRYFFESHFPDYHLDIVEIKENGNFFEFLAQELRRIFLIANRYSNDSPRKWEVFAQRMILKMLRRFSKKDNGSHELLHFGWFIRALKRH